MNYTVNQDCACKVMLGTSFKEADHIFVDNKACCGFL